MDLREMRQKWNNYGELLNEPEGDGSILGRSFIIAKCGVTDVLKLLDFIDTALELEDSEV
jgi:hypothetical protein